MEPHIRAMIAAATFASITGRKVAGLFDHAAGRDLRIAAECRGDQLQGFDGDREAKFAGTLPEIFDSGEQSFVSFERTGDRVKGYDRASGTFYDAHITDGLVQVYDHGAGAWFAYDVQDAQAPQSYHRR
jgi:hypothetical protein